VLEFLATTAFVGSRAARVLSLALALGLAWSVGGFPWAASGIASAQERPVAALVGPVSPQIVARVRGQTADLPWRVEVLDVDESLSPEARALEAARRSDARLAFVVLTEEPTRVVLVRVQPAVEVETRLVASASEQRLGDSARAEAISLIIRGALTAAALPGAQAAPIDPAPIDPPEGRAPGPIDAPGDGAASSVRLGAQVFAGAGVSVDGHAPLASLGPRLRASLLVEDCSLGVEVHLSTPERLTSTDLVLTLLRLELHAAFAVTWHPAPAVSLGIGAGAGATLFERTTRETGPALEATASRWLASPSAALEARLGWLLDAHVGLELSLGILALIAPPSLVVASARGEEARHDLWPVGPRGALGITFQ
jgi:hypothetical protein